MPTNIFLSVHMNNNVIEANLWWKIHSICTYSKHTNLKELYMSLMIKVKKKFKLDVNDNNG